MSDDDNNDEDYKKLELEQLLNDIITKQEEIDQKFIELFGDKPWLTNI